MYCPTIKQITIPACEAFTGIQTNLPNTFLKLRIDYVGTEINMTGTTDATGLFPVQIGSFPAGMVNQWDVFTLTFTDASDQPIAVDSEGNSTFRVTPAYEAEIPEC